MQIALWIWFLLIIVSSLDGYIFLYQSERHDSIDHFDCIYYTKTAGETMIYCRRPNTGESDAINPYNTCQNDGKQFSFADSIRENISPQVVLKWSSSIEMVDKYAHAFVSNLTGEDIYLCNCIKPGTFGKYCQYELTHQTDSFESSVDAQFEEYEKSYTAYGWGIQHYGQIICYETLECDYGLLCLNWHDICDGEQHCIDGRDEENCDKLEFNECNPGEYRCSNGMCIDDEFWLDGKLSYDSMLPTVVQQKSSFHLFLV
jgi:hypothetical protein